jgi:hypothetical protein
MRVRNAIDIMARHMDRAMDYEAWPRSAFQLIFSEAFATGDLSRPIDEVPTTCGVCDGRD